MRVKMQKYTEKCKNPSFGGKINYYTGQGSLKNMHLMYTILFCKNDFISNVHIINKGKGFIPNYNDVLKQYFLNACTAILLYVIFHVHLC